MKKSHPISRLLNRRNNPIDNIIIIENLDILSIGNASKAGILQLNNSQTK